MTVGKANILERIDETLAQRRTADASSSYVASLYQNGAPAILKKISEEAEEVLMAASESDERIVYEMADLFFHCQVLLAYRGLNTDHVLEELIRRFGTSGFIVQQERGQATPTKE